jgi:hypothetical protein
LFAVPQRALTLRLQQCAVDVAMLHMRIRANLTADEHRKILDFLQSGN